MTITWQISKAELSRVYAASYQGRKARLCLAINSASLTVDSTTAQWDAVEISGQASNGYARVEWTLGAGSYSAGLGMVQGPSSLATFQATPNGLGLTFDTAYMVLGTINGGTTTWDANVARVLVLPPANQALQPGQPLSFQDITLVDDITVMP